MVAYYNEHEPYAAAWLRNLIDAGHIAPGIVDTRSIVDVQPSDLDGFTQCHFFAGIGGWSLAARLAKWPDSRELWTGSCPCQPFSVAGAGRAQDDDRHLWPNLFRLVSARRPSVLMGEQVAAAVGKDWLDGIFADLEGIGYAAGSAVVPACAVDAPHRRDRLWFVADADQPCAGEERQQRGGEFGGPRCDSCACPGCNMADTDSVAREQGRSHHCRRDQGSNAQPWSRLGGDGGFWSRAGAVIGHDGKARRVEPGIRLLAHGIPARVGKLRAYGNAIVPQVAAEVISAYMEAA